MEMEHAMETPMRLVMGAPFSEGASRECWKEATRVGPLSKLIVESRSASGCFSLGKEAPKVDAGEE